MTAHVSFANQKYWLPFCLMCGCCVLFDLVICGFTEMLTNGIAQPIRELTNLTQRLKEKSSKTAILSDLQSNDHDQQVLKEKVRTHR